MVIIKSYLAVIRVYIYIPSSEYSESRPFGYDSTTNYDFYLEDSYQYFFPRQLTIDLTRAGNYGILRALLKILPIKANL